MSDRLSSRRGAPHARNLERVLLWLSVVGTLPAAVLAGIYLWSHPFTPEVRWTLSALVVLAWIGAASASRELAIRSLTLIANLLGALREGDYSIRGLTARS